MIQIAEDMGLVSELDLAVADKAMEQRNQLVKLYGNEVEITINVSLNSDKPVKSLFKDLMSLFRKHRKHLPYVTVELTESAYFSNENKNGDLLFELRKKGVKIAIDDFGTGYSSFSYLKDGNFDVLKIDRDFIINLVFGSHNYYIVKMITQLAHTLGVEVVAEGVESIKEVNILKDLKVDYLQGFYFAKPLPVKLLSAEINDREELRDLVEPEIQDVVLFTTPPLLSPTHTLREVKALFDRNSVHVLPVIIDKQCVGVLTKEKYNLHATPTLGTDRETMQEYRSLDKVVSAMMEPLISCVHETINASEIHEKIRNHIPLPWVVINDSGDYVGMIDTVNMIHYLNA
jgi:EAL domain-containing protein (putative c-di-GMP-specific phosphodiesterase class I)